MEKITDILFARLETENGKKLGHVFDFRSAGEPEYGLKSRERTIDAIVYGTNGLWEVLGLKKPNVKTIAWSSVKKVEPGKIIIADEQAGE
jgi:hypothetical protein